MRVRSFMVFAAVTFFITSCGYLKIVTDANESYVREDYCDAAEKCALAYTKLTRKGGGAQESKGNMAFKTAESYRMIEQYRDANEWYERAKLLEYEQVMPEVLLYNADVLRKMREFDKAIADYKMYKTMVPGDERANAGIESCENYDQYKADKTRHTIENQGTINKVEFDMAPVFGDRKQTKMYFGSSRPGSTGKNIDPRSCESYMDIWVSDLDKKGNWTKPYLVKGDSINTEANEGTVCFDDRKKTMFFTRCPTLKKQNLGCDIWMSTAKGKTAWNNPTKLALKMHDSISVGHPCTADGKYLIFASDMPGGFGGRDLWYTDYDPKSKTWSAPKNMGPEINTKGNELFPSFGLDGGLIYASDGMPGLGGLDIFKAKKVGEENKWENPTNLGTPINSENNDYALVEKDPRLGYFTSERKSANGENKPDIYSYVMPPNVFSLKLSVTDLAEGDKIEGAIVTVTGPDGEWTGITDENGSVYWDKKPTGDRYINEESGYTMNISMDGYYENPNPHEISTEGLNYDQDFVVDMGLFPKRPIRLPEVQYHLDKWTFVVDSTINSLDSLLFVYDLLEARPELVIELSSHTDARGSNARNKKLSINRAIAIYKYLVDEKGVDPRRIIPIGKGEETPRTVYLQDGLYKLREPKAGEFETIVLTEAYINKFRRSDVKTFKKLHQLNRRAEGDVHSLDFDPEAAPAADPSYSEYVRYP